jgi:hypothetical protein
LAALEDPPEERFRRLPDEVRQRLRECSWAFDSKDTASTLVRTFLARTKLDSFFEQMLLTTAVLRNRLSASQGAGPHSKLVPPHVALYALNVTATGILIIAQDTGEA